MQHFNSSCRSRSLVRKEPDSRNSWAHLNTHLRLWNQSPERNTLWTSLIPMTRLLQRTQSSGMRGTARPSLRTRSVRQLRISLVAAPPVDVIGLSWLTHLYCISEAGPLDQQTRVVVPIFKKVDRRVSFNYWGSHSSASPGRSTPRCQRGEFVRQSNSERGGTTQCLSWSLNLFTLSRTLELVGEFAQPVYMCFRDLVKAEDKSRKFTHLVLMTFTTLVSQFTSTARLVPAASRTYSMRQGSNFICTI